MPDSLAAVVYGKFKSVLGEPHQIVGHDYYWGLRAHRYVAAINVLLNGGKNEPVVWVFDPHDPQDGVSHRSINSEAEADSIIEAIVNRVRAAAR